MTRPTTYTYRPGISQDMVDAIEAVETTLTDAAEQLKREPVAFRNFNEITEYTAAGLYLCQENVHGSLIDEVAAANLGAIGGVCNYGYWRQGRRGVYVPSNNFAWGANVHAPGVANYAVASAFAMAAHQAADTNIAGYKDSGGGSTSNGVYAFVETSDDKVYLNINDGTLSQAVLVGGALTFGDVYVLGYHVNRDTDLLYATLINTRTEVEVEATPFDISAYGTLTGAGATRGFQVGNVPSVIDGTGCYHFGVAVVTAGIGGADVASNLARRLAGVE